MNSLFESDIFCFQRYKDSESLEKNMRVTV